jgi:hypothetical protein
VLNLIPLYLRCIHLFLFAVISQRFLRGMPHLCDKMRRLTGKDAGARKKAEAERTPDLHAISRLNPLPEGPIVMDFPSVSEASFMAHRRAQMLQQMDLIAASNRMGQPMVPSMGGMAGMGYPNGQDPVLMQQYGGPPNIADMQNQLFMRQWLASQNMGGSALGGGAPNFGAPNGLGAAGTGGATMPNNMGAEANVGMGGQLDMSQLLAFQNAQNNPAQSQANFAQMMRNQQQQFDQVRGGAIPNEK